MDYSTINLTDKTKEELDELYYPLRQKKKIKSYSELISKLIKYFNKRKDEKETN
jgi:metal-responsive CopG/Arc/MetJ family transcriptional regulator